MREKYETLKLADLREIAKNLDIKGSSTMSKSEIIDILVEKEKEENAAGKAVVQSVAPVRQAYQGENASRPYNPEAGKEEPEEKMMVTIGPKGYEQEYDARLDSHTPVCGIIEVMPDTCKNIFKGYYWDNFTTSTIADMFGFANANSVKTQKYKCLQKFRNRYNELMNKNHG